MFRAFCIFFLASAACFNIARGATPQFDAGNQLYETGKFSEAADAYRRLLMNGEASPAVYFNLGNACFRGGNLGEAVVAYRKAQELSPRDPDIHANLSFARQQVRGPRWEASRWERFLTRLSLNEWAGITCAAIWVLFSLLTVAQWKAAWKPALRPWTWTSAAALLAAAALTTLNWHIHRNRTIAVVVVQETPVRNGPLEESQAAFTASSGAEFLVLDRKDKWLMVSAGANRTGWVPSAATRFD
jgi:tetratricopeptide (TPR) repeat protein